MTPREPADELAQSFVRFSVEAGVLRFGEFKTKAGRLSPYFFNAGLFDDGAKLQRLAEFYARRLVASGLDFDLLFGPAYKGITLAAGVAIELARLGRNVPFAYNRKEAKDHGEGGLLVGAPVRGRVLIIDDVISAGTSVRESVAMIQAAGATPCGVAIALDRQERAAEQGVDLPHSATQYVTAQFGLPVIAIATLDSLLHFLEGERGLGEETARVAAYRQRYGV
ncbi:orotate phosphoribosyltransferase [Aquabacterium sp. J223]|uniref:orotate phosphoribosyltransferase n=1 Tax=Aquabacterium sp. J223 TaxID=2898431 RepID=UPI0021AE102E|nr:orotate phosphoribosyltransferase [Aquabacterium sp. J223]UUX96265.1 orotate phosphoribosyltransferase [Aquabacterium sp. J223]